MKFRGTLKDVNGNPAGAHSGRHLRALYSERSGAASQNAKCQPDENGHYTVLLGSTKPDGLAVDLTSGQAQS